MRLMVSVDGGFVGPEWRFARPFGGFWVVDGKCRFFVDYDTAVGVYSGVLSDADAAQLSVDVG